MKKEIYQKSSELQKESMRLRNNAFDEKMSYDEAVRIRKEQDELYKKSMFYKNLIKSFQKV